MGARVHRGQVPPPWRIQALPRDAELVVRTDSVLPVSGGLQGEKSLTTLEYWADRRSDLHIHFHEDRSDLPESESDGSYGNTTDSLGWLRGMPAGSLDQDEIERAFRMLGSTDQPELPGDIPNELGLIIGIKNFTCLLYTSPSPRDLSTSRMPSSA